LPSRLATKDDDAKMEAPDIRYAWSGASALAYQIVGDGPIDLVYLPQFIQNLEWTWGHPLYARYCRRLASFSRLIVIDQRGHGCSDHSDPHDFPSLETQVDDVLTVMDAAGSAQAALCGAQETGFIATLAAATHPGRVSALILYGATASYSRTDVLPWEWSRERWDEDLEWMREWGTHRHAARYLGYAAPSLVHDEETVRWFAAAERLTIGPGGAVTELRREMETDLTHVLSAINVPTLVLHRTKDPSQSVRSGRYLASKIPGARLVELPGEDSLAWVGEADTVADEIEEFLTGTRRKAPSVDRALATVLFTDVVGSTQVAARLGDARWKDVLAEHHRLARGRIQEYRGRVVSTAGDGILAVFDGPARAVRCAQELAETMRSLGLEIRAGCHTGEVELDGDEVRGIAVHIGARVAAIAGPSEVLVSRTVRDLVAGSGLAFEDRGEHALKGVPDRWHLFRVAS
jgi:class 3 adenylate cyclase